MSRGRWTFWPRGGGSTPPKRKAPAGYWLGDALQVVLAWVLPSSAAVVAALGQIALAAVLCVVALGIWLRLWRGRVRERRAGRFQA